MKEVVINSIIYEYDSISELPVNEQELVRLARDSALRAYAPYSGFRVGAALLLENGEVITGNNQENAAYPSGICAERVALFYAGSRFPEVAVMSIAITALNQEGESTGNPVYPCGACRQVILEAENRHGKSQRLIFAGESRVHAIDSIKTILPLYFDKDSLLSDFRK